MCMDGMQLRVYELTLVLYVQASTKLIINTIIFLLVFYWMVHTIICLRHSHGLMYERAPVHLSNHIHHTIHCYTSGISMPLLLHTRP